MSPAPKLTAKRLRNWLGRTRCLSAQDVSASQEQQSPTEATLSPNRSMLLYSRIKSMIQDCQSSHHDRCKTSMSFPHGARVIDCTSRRIVPLLHRRYLVLSYVWGIESRSAVARETNSECEERALPSYLPQTILNALDITINLGYHYLWIDRYCIDQGHSADKLHQINQMGNIYSHAELAICALGSSDEAGIFGVSQARDTRADRVVGPAQCLRDSVWSTRGWTLQEMVLARRCLIFSAEACYLACCTAIYNDDITHAKPLISDYESRGSECVRFPRGNMGESIFSPRSIYASTHVCDDYVRTRYSSGGRECVLFPGGNMGRNMGRNISYHRSRYAFTQLRDEYAKRTLGFEIDVLSAFVGFLTRYPYPSYCGVVAFPQDEVEEASAYSPEDDVTSVRLHRGRDQILDDNFLLALTWRVSRGELSIRRDSALPSWTWLNQTRPFVENVDEWPYIRESVPAYRARVELPTPDGSKMLFSKYNDTFRGCSPHTILPFDLPHLYIRSVVVEWTLEVVDSRRTIRQQWGTRERWPSFMPDTTSEIWWDNLPPWQLSEFGTVTDVARVPTHDLAVLMVGHHWGLKWDWLLIRNTYDGKFEREGLVRFRDWSAPKRWNFVPPQEYLKSIELV